MRLYFKPQVLLIWLGALIMFVGGGLSLSDRRLRVGAPRPAKTSARLAAGGVNAVALFIRDSGRRPSSSGSVCSCERIATSCGEPSEMLADPALEARARAVSKELRCMVCQNQSIDDSDAPLAHDLRVLVRERLKAGDSDPQVMDFLVARYGEFVLLQPPFAWHTAALWGLPPAALLVGLARLCSWCGGGVGAPAAEVANLSLRKKTRCRELRHGD